MRGRDNIFIYPMYVCRGDNYNPYIYDLTDAFSRYLNVHNAYRKMRWGVLDLLLNWRSTDIFYLNWVEDITSRRLWRLQYVILQLFFRLIKNSDKEFIWVHHNKHPHSGKNRWNKKIQEQLISGALIIVSHTSQSFKLINPLYHDKLRIESHPIEIKSVSETFPRTVPKRVLIWGTMVGRKNPVKLLEEIAQNRALDNFNFVFAGKHDLDESIVERVGKNVTFLNKFLTEDELSEHHVKSDLILFTHHGGSILSSGALATSLGYISRIVGPRDGAFIDLEDRGIVACYEDWSGVQDALHKALKIDLSQVRSYGQTHTWHRFAKYIKTQL